MEYDPDVDDITVYAFPDAASILSITNPQIRVAENVQLTSGIWNEILMTPIWYLGRDK